MTQKPKPAAKVIKRETEVNGKVYHNWLLVYYDQAGRRQRKTYRTVDAANTALVEYNEKQAVESEKRGILKNRIGEKAERLTTDELLDAVAALDILKRKVALAEAARFFVEHHNPDGGKRTVSEVVTEYLREAGDDSLRPASIQDLKTRLARFEAPYGGRQISTIKRREVTDWLRGEHTKRKDGTPISPLSRKHYHTVVGGLFNYAVEQEYIAVNPLAKKSRRRRKQNGMEDERMPEILTVGEVKAVMAAAEQQPSMVPALAIGFFAGVRTNELRKLEWKHIDLSAKRITIPPTIAKKRSVRHIDIADNLAAWLAPHKQESGMVAPVEWRFRFDKVRELAKLDKWPHNAMRHCFATFYLLRTDDANKTALQLGHRDPDLLFTHYRGLATREDATKFWSIMPKERADGALEFPVRKVS